MTNTNTGDTMTNIDLKEIIENTVRVLGAGHFTRPAGSFVTICGEQDEQGQKTVEMLSNSTWEEVTNEAFEIGAGFGTCRYFRADIPENCLGFEAMCLLSQLPDNRLGEVRLQRGHHGDLEFIIKGLTPTATKTMHLVTGEHEGSIVVFTWFPGRLSPAPRKDNEIVVKFA